MEIFECAFDIEVENKLRHSVMQAPRAALEQQFLNLAQQAARSDKPVKIKMGRRIPIFDDFENRWIERESSLAIANNAYIKVKGEDI